MKSTLRMCVTGLLVCMTGLLLHAEDLILENQTITNDQDFATVGTITAQTDVIIDSPAIVNFFATDGIILKPGFEARQGSTFTASVIDSDSDGLVDNWELDHFGNLNSQGTDDTDYDGVTNLQELAIGTDPNSRNINGDAMWVWLNGSLNALNNQTARDDLINFCSQHHINELFVSADTIGDNTLVTQWENLLSELHANGIRVEALIGNADWLMAPGGWDEEWNDEEKNDRDFAIDVNEDDGLVDNLLNYQAAHTSDPSQMFDGIHFDIEMNELKDCSVKPCVDWIDPTGPQPPNHTFVDKEVRVTWFLEFIDAVHQARTTKGFTAEELPINWDIARNCEDPENAGFPLEYPAGSGDERPGWQHILNRLDRITFLTYVDRVRFAVDSMQTELEYIKGMADPPLIRYSFEFQEKFRSELLSGESLYQEDYLTFINMIHNLESIMDIHSLFRGFALHAYDNEVPADNDYRTWVQDTNQSSFDYPNTISFVPTGAIITIPPSDQDPMTGTEIIENPVYVRLKIKAHPKYLPDNSDNSLKKMISIVPVGWGYATEASLANLVNVNNKPENYTGITPNPWWYYAHVRWWPNPASSEWPEVEQLGVCWENPANTSNTNDGVVRDIILDEGESYRFIVAYNGDALNDIEGNFLSKGTVAINPPGSLGDSFNDPVEITLYLGEIQNYDDDKDMNGNALVHNNDSVVVIDSDHDGLVDGKETLIGTSWLSEDTDGDGLADGEEVNTHGSDPLRVDTDGDGFLDGEEVNNGTDPTVPN